MGKRSKRKPAGTAAVGKSSARPSAASAGAEPRRQLPVWLGVAIIIVAAFWVYLPAMGGGWLWDDDWYITNQPLLRDAGGLWKFWFAPGSWVEYYPVEETLLWIEWHLFGLNTLGYHLVTVTLHAANALLVWRVLAKLGLRKAWLGGLLFAVHPAAVDSVAWIAETKNTLSGLFCLLTIGAWLDYDDVRKPSDYFRALALFTIAMLCKIAVAPLPVVMLLHAWWKRRRVAGSDLAAVAPFFALSVVLAVLSTVSGDIYRSHLHETPDVLPVLGFADRFALAGQSLGVYFAHVVWPVNLLPNYPQWVIGADSPLAYVPWLLIALALGALWLRRGGWGAPALFALGFFILFLAPFLGFLVASYDAFTWVMDHFLYLAIIGPIGLFAAALGSIEDRVLDSARIAVTGATTLIIALLAIEAHAYAGAFSDEATLWGYTVEHNSGDWLAQDNLGKALILLNRPEEAEPHLRAALQLRPGRAQAHLNLGRALVAQNRVPEGLAEYDIALAAKPADPEIHNQKGVALLQIGRTADALAEFEQAVALRPRYAIGLENLGIALALSGRLDEAVDRFRASLEINPNDAPTHLNEGRALRQLGREAEAEEQFHLALQLDPGNAAAQAELAKPASRNGASGP